MKQKVFQDLWAHMSSTRRAEELPTSQSNTLSAQPLTLPSSNSNPPPIKRARFMLFLVELIMFLRQHRNR